MVTVSFVLGRTIVTFQAPDVLVFDDTHRPPSNEDIDINVYAERVRERDRETRAAERRSQAMLRIISTNDSQPNSL